jgi:hypothetical protein
VRLDRVSTQRDPIESISAVTLLTVDMVEAVAFYQTLGFSLLYGGPEARFTSFRVGTGYLNLQLDAVLRDGLCGAESCYESTTSTRCTDARSRPDSTRKPHQRTHPGANGTSTSVTETVTS